MSDYNDGIIPEPCLRLDYGFGQQYASVELGDGTGYVRVTDELRSEHHRMKRWYDDELRAALAENAKLCGQYETVIADYRSEVAKLRELCADIYEMAYHEYPSAFEATFAGRMRELGIEVDG